MATLLWDSDDGGNIFSQKSVAGEPLTFDMACGRGTITVGGGSGNGLFDTAVFYLTDPGHGFFLDASTGQFNRALSGPLQLQTRRGNFTGATLSGNVIAHVIGRPDSTSTNVDAGDGFVSRSLSNNSFALIEVTDFRSSSGLSRLNLSSSFTEAFTIDANTGRGTITFGGNTNALYIIGQDRYVLIDETLPPNNSLRTDFFNPR